MLTAIETLLTALRPFRFCLLVLPLLAARTGEAPYRDALPGYHYQFPRDHFEHKDFRTEWWYYTGNLTDERGHRFGFELVFFRQGAGERQPAANPAGEGKTSPWAVGNLYLAHAALTDVSGKRFLYEERLNRAGPGIAGASFEQQRIWNGNWSSSWQGVNQHLRVITGDFQFDLEATPVKPFVIHGENGVSQKGEGAGHASHYVSFTRLRVAGSVVTEGKPHRVQGTAWMDHEWFSRSLAKEQAGWDSFSVQLNNGTELMLGQLRRTDGSIDPHSSGTFVDAAGKAHHLRHADFSLRPGPRWHQYPIEWRVEVPSLHIALDCRAVLPDQELRGKDGGLSYWEGAVDYAGTHTGVGYVEMTGYNGAGPLQ